MHETGRIPNAATTVVQLAKIAYRTLMDWKRRGGAPAKWQGPPFEGLARGARDVDDPLYGHLA